MMWVTSTKSTRVGVFVATTLVSSGSSWRAANASPKKLASREAPHHAGVAPDVRALHAHAALKDDAHAFDGASLHPDQIALLVRLGPCRKAPQHLVNLLRRHAPKEGGLGQELGIYTTHVAPPKKSRNVVNTT